MFLFFCTIATISMAQNQENIVTEKNEPRNSVNVSNQEPVANSKKISKRVVKPVAKPVDAQKETKKNL